MIAKPSLKLARQLEIDLSQLNDFANGLYALLNEELEWQMKRLRYKLLEKVFGELFANKEFYELYKTAVEGNGYSVLRLRELVNNTIENSDFSVYSLELHSIKNKVRNFIDHKIKQYIEEVEE
ncbi:MAG: hypothetical protein P3W91_005925 [Fervidobacterium sp.]|nr:hypothetical protein [Fervidobacterium sp.]